MFRAIEKLNLGTNFAKAITAIYQTQSASLRVNNDTTEKFKVHKGTCQGPLSPH